MTDTETVTGEVVSTREIELNDRPNGGEFNQYLEFTIPKSGTYKLVRVSEE